jgi:hypothetical protein
MHELRATMSQKVGCRCSPCELLVPAGKIIWKLCEALKYELAWEPTYIRRIAWLLPWVYKQDAETSLCS